MRVLHIVNSLDLGGAEQLAVDLATHQKRRGLTVGIATIAATKSIEGASVNACRIQQLQDSGIEVLHFGRNSRTSTLASVALHRLAHGRHDVVHSHLAAGVAAAALGLQGNPRIVWTLHNTRFRYSTPIITLSRLAVDHYVGCGPAVTRSFSRLLRGRITTIVNGIQLERFEGSNERLRREDSLRLIAVGGLRPQKNYGRLIEAVALARRRLAALGVDATLAIVGEGEERLAVESTISRLHASSYVSLLGASGNVPRAMSQADLFVSASDHEGLPLSMIEAMASGLPCVCTPFLGADQLIQHGISGQISQSFDASSLAAQIVALGLSPDRRKAMGQNARVAAEAFSIETCADRYIALYSKPRQR